MSDQPDLRVLIVDDEQLSTSLLSSIVDATEGFVVVGVCKNGREAIEVLQKQAFDVVLMDIQMPGLTGLEVVERTQADRLPAVIFATAFDEFACKAFDLHAVDYVVKPFDPERVRVALQRAAERVAVAVDDRLDARGDLHIAFSAGYSGVGEHDLYYARYNGVSWTLPEKVADDDSDVGTEDGIAAADVFQLSPALAVHPDEPSVYMAFAGGAGEGFGVKDATDVNHHAYFETLHPSVSQMTKI